MEKIITSMKTLALTVALTAVSVSAESKLVNPSSYSSSVVISKVFYAGAKDNANKNYLLGRYVELYNNSADTLNLSGMYVGLVESDAKASAWTTERMAESHKDSVVLKQVFRLPESTKLNPYTTMLIANSAIDHSANGENFPDLSMSDFEAKDTQGKVQNNDNVAALELVYTAFSSISNMNLMQGGACALVLFTADTDLTQLVKVFAYGKDKGNEYVLIPRSKVIDGVDIVKLEEEDLKRLDSNVDSGYVAITAKTGYNGEVVYRKTAYVVGGNTVLYDTNDSRRDFQLSTAVRPREYDAEPAGLTEESITIPESGFLAINMEKPFFGPKTMRFCYVNASNNAQTTDLRYNEFAGDSTLLMKGDWIAIAQPGTYMLKLSDSQGVMRNRTSNQGWCNEAQKELTGSQKTRRIYKFSNQKDKVGFVRDEKYASVNWNTADFAEDEHLYITLTDAIGERIYEVNGAASYDELTFIPWHGSTPDDIVTVGIKGVNVMTDKTAVFFDLQGRRVASPVKGMYIRDGKKYIFK